MPMMAEPQMPPTSTWDEHSPGREVFPLPLTPFENFLLADDRAGHPMTFSVEMIFRGHLQPHLFTEAMLRTVARHPLLTSRLEGTSGSWCWNPVNRSVDDLVEFDTAPVTDIIPLRSLNARRAEGVRAVLAEGELGSSVRLYFHHGCCDGQGARQFILDLMTAYANLVRPDQPIQADPLDWAALAGRGRIAYPPAERVRELTANRNRLWDALVFLAAHPATLAAPPRAEPAPTRGPRQVVKYTFDLETTAALQRRALDTGVTLNDVAIGLLFSTLSDWNRRHGLPCGDRPIRIIMPTDLRDRRDFRLPAANRMSFGFLTRNVDECRHLGDLLSGIRRETEYIKGVRLGLDFLCNLATFQRVPGFLPLILNASRCFATSVLTNLGDPARRFRRRFPHRDGVGVIGDVELEQIVGTPPIRPETRAGWGLCLFSKKMVVSLAADSEFFDESASRELLETYVNAWRQWLLGPATWLAPMPPAPGASQPAPNGRAPASEDILATG